MTARNTQYPLHRREVAGALMEDRENLLVIAGLGAPAWDAAAVGDSDLVFPMWGGMGGAAMIGCGLAKARPETRVMVITGDGEMLMGAGSLATIAAQQPANLAIVVFDNESFGETGRQPTHTASATDLAGLAKAAGISNSFSVRDDAGLADILPVIRYQPGPIFACIKVRLEELALVLPPRDGGLLKTRFRTALAKRNPAR